MTKTKMTPAAHRLMCEIARAVARGRYEAETLANAASDVMDGKYVPGDACVKDAVAAGLIVPSPDPRDERNGISPVTWYLTGLGCKLVRKPVGPAQPDPSHRWDRVSPQARCTLCGAYRHLSSGFAPCEVARGRFVVQGYSKPLGWVDTSVGDSPDGLGLPLDEAVTAARKLHAEVDAWMSGTTVRAVRVVPFADRRAAAMAAGVSARDYHHKAIRTVLLLQ